MPRIWISEKLPAKQSLKKHLLHNILNSEDVRSFGGPDTTTTAYGMTKADKPCGNAPRGHEWGEQEAASIPKVSG